MKIVCVDGSRVDGTVPFAIKPASALLLPHNPFFCPDFAGSVTARMGGVVRISKPGRSVARKFAPRHYDSFAVALNMVADDLLDFCFANRLPLDMATSFDSSFPVSKFMGINDLDAGLGQISLSWMKNGALQDECLMGLLEPGFDEALAAVSQYVTLREGDYVFVPSRVACGVGIGDNVELRVNDVAVMRFAVK